MAGIAALKGTVKHYDWGGSDFIPGLLLTDNKEQKPFAEYWLGAHPQAQCSIAWPDGTTTGLNEYLGQHAAAFIGEKVLKQFGHIPYLLKILDVKDMLSIQVHPSKKEAERDFAEENNRGIPLDSPQRNYKDDNHKPELMVAMGEFWLLHGFRPVAEMKQVLTDTPELAFLLPVFDKERYAGLYKKVMTLPQEEVNRSLQPLLDRILPVYKSGSLPKSSPDYWAAKASVTFPGTNGAIDRGIFSVYLFNLVQLNKGEAIFQDAGVPHAYLEGQNVEIMASSDNVLRGGLTTKYIDVPELLKHVKTEATHVQVLKGDTAGEETVYKTPAPDFELSAFRLAAGAATAFTASSAEIIMLTSGEALAVAEGEEVLLQKGQLAAIISAGTRVVLQTKTRAVIFRAAVPV